MVLKKNVFKAYDIRGIYPADLDEETAYLVGRAFVTFLRCKKVVVGIDMRSSSPSLAKELIRGITDQGADATEIGMCTTPMMNFAVAKYKFDGGIMVSASHSASQYNAFKLVKYPMEQISSDSGMNDIYGLCSKNDFPPAEKKGKVSSRNVLDDYKAHVLDFANEINGLKVVADYGNGVGAISAKPVFSALPIKVINMYDQPDGRFPNHEANTAKYDTLKDLQKRVIEEKADIGIAFDGDADRSIVVAGDGKIIRPDKMLAVLAEEELKEHPGENVFHDLRFSKAIRNRLLELGGKPQRLKVGNPFYKLALAKQGGVIAGEFSGHIMFRDNYCIDDGLFAALKFMRLLCITGKDIHELVKPYEVFFQTEEINLHVDDADFVLAKVAADYCDGSSIDLDGVLIEYKDWWFSLRKSNTEPIVRLMLEADTKELMEKKMDELLAIIGGRRE
jgi:phosphomannomutase